MHTPRDTRQQFILFKYKDKILKTWVSGLNLNYYFLISQYANTTFYTTSVQNAQTTHINTKLKTYYILNLLLKNLHNNLFFNVDIGYLSTPTQHVVHSVYSCFLTNERLTMLIPTQTTNVNYVPSLSNVFKSTSWVERELQEFNNCEFTNLRDSRRLLSDYCYSKDINHNSYKNTSYDLIYQDIYIRVLHWFFYFLYLFFIITLSFILYNKSLLQLLILSEVLIILFIGLTGTLAIYFNIYYLVGLAVLLLIFGGLELSINLLFLVIKCY